jgi:serine/threonine protein phosphatase PrpC
MRSFLFRRSVAICPDLTTLRSFKSTNLTHTLPVLAGARLLPPDYCLVLALEASNAATELHENGWRPTPRAVASTGAYLASALAAMHAAGVVHRDIKPANILLGAGRVRPRLTDLGIAVSVEEAAAALTHATPTGGFHKQRMVGGSIYNCIGDTFFFLSFFFVLPTPTPHPPPLQVGTLEYMAPEVLLKRPSTPAADTFALAVTLNELLTATIPYSDCTRDNPLAHTILEMGYGRQELATAVAAEGLRPATAAGTPPALAALLKECWRRTPEERPSAADVAARLEAIAVGLPPEEWERTSVAAAAVAAVATPGRTSSSKLPLEGLQKTLGCSNPPFPGTLPPWWSSLPPASVNQVPVIGSFASAGPRGEDKMEDRCVVVRGLFGLPDAFFIGVFDGHRGAHAAEYLADGMEAHLAARWLQCSSPSELLKAALLDADSEFRARQDAEWEARRERAGGAVLAGARTFPGSTATAVLIVGGRLAVAGLGDSRAVLCRGGAAQRLTRDHTADDEAERMRILAAGGEVSVRAGAWRVGTVGAQVTRSVGDADLETHGVIAEAEISELDLTPEDTFLIVATDGLWERVSDDEAVALLQDTVKQPAMSARRLVAEALGRGGGDNTTAVVTVLRADEGTAERVYYGGKLKERGGGGGGHGGQVRPSGQPPAEFSPDEVQETL